MTLWKSEEFQFCIAAASSASRHTALLVSVHYGPSQIHYSSNIVIKIFPINQTTPLRKLYNHMILELQLLLNTIFI
jgi:hypothetical protein